LLHITKLIETKQRVITGALKIATLAGSQYLSVDDKIGKLKPGMIADIVAVKGDPLEDITATRNVHALWIEGKAVDLNRLRLDIKESLANVSDNYSIEIPPFGISDQYKKV
jgi:cytosine/adenosine deaminase-related metal-dependent hydrolase